MKAIGKATFILYSVLLGLIRLNSEPTDTDL